MSTTTRSIDTLIIGQGLAGTFLAHFLLQAGQSVMVVDNGDPASASRACLGILDPIIGRRFKPAWKVETLFPFAEQTITKFGEASGQHYYASQNIFKIFIDIKQKTRWERDCAAPEYKKYIENNASPPQCLQHLRTEHGWVELTGAALVRVTALLDDYRDLLRRKGLLIEVAFDHAELEIGHGVVRWRGVTAKRVVFCEGSRVRENPWFGRLPWQFTKGETLTIRSADLSPEKIYYRGVFVVPANEQRYQVGATHVRSDCSTSSTPEGRDELCTKLEAFFSGQYEIIDQHAGVRTALPDYKPVLGVHPEIKELAIFNGLGSKGITQGPYFASRMAARLLHGAPVEAEVDLARFELPAS